MTDNFTKIIRIGTYLPEWRKTPFSVFCQIQFRDGRLSITGVEGPLPSGNAAGSCGQIDDILREYEIARWGFANGWNESLLQRFLDAWCEWHLNDMKAGSPAQEAFLKANPITDRLNHYEAAVVALAKAGLTPDPNYSVNGAPYVYGSAWLRTEVPADVLDFLRSLPNTDKKPAWV